MDAELHARMSTSQSILRNWFTFPNGVAAKYIPSKDTGAIAIEALRDCGRTASALFCVASARTKSASPSCKPSGKVQQQVEGLRLRLRREPRQRASRRDISSEPRVVTADAAGSAAAGAAISSLLAASLMLSSTKTPNTERSAEV